MQPKEGKDKSHGNALLSRVAKASHKFGIKDKRSKKVHPSAVDSSNIQGGSDNHNQSGSGSRVISFSEADYKPRTYHQEDLQSPESEESDNKDSVKHKSLKQKHNKSRSHPAAQDESKQHSDMPSFRAPRRKSRKSSFLCKSVVDNEPLPMVDELLEEKPKTPRTYGLGEVGKKEDMIIHRCFEEKLVAIAQLKEYDHAFVWRSNGNWTYAVVVARGGGADAYLKFVVDESGHTKQIPLRQWSKFLRLAKPTVPPFKQDEQAGADSQGPAMDFLSSTNAINGEETDVEKLKAEMGGLGEMPEFSRPNFKDDQRRKSESFLSATNKRCALNKRGVHPYETKSSSSVTTKQEPSSTYEPKTAMRLRQQRDCHSRPILRRSFGQRFSEMDGSKLRVSFRISTVEPETVEEEPVVQEEPVPEGGGLDFSAFDKARRKSGIQSDMSCSRSVSSFDVKFNQRAFLSALDSINKKTSRDSFVTVDA